MARQLGAIRFFPPQFRWRIARYHFSTTDERRPHGERVTTPDVVSAQDNNAEVAALWPVATFTLAYVTVALVFALIRGSPEFLVYIAVLIVMMGVVWAVHRRIQLHMASLWALSLWGLAHMVGGLLVVPTGWPTSEPSRVFYTWWLIPERLKYDHVVHAYGFGITTWVCWQGIRAALKRRDQSTDPTTGLLVLTAAAGMGFGALNEVIEFVATLLVPETGVGGYVNTGWDLVANLVGATVAVTLIRIIEGRPSTSGGKKRRVTSPGRIAK